MATLRIDDELYREYAEAATQAGRTANEFIGDALRDWLGELQEDLDIARTEIAEYGRSGDAVDATQYLRERGIKYE